jgi:2,3-bisphosphoglycerate-dependent phosphoglycerate mutase
MARLVLLRHGESTANAHDVFAGWLDLPLTERGAHEARSAGRSLAAMRADSIHTSVLGRAINTGHLVAEAAGWQAQLRRDWRLNERHYGALQGLAKEAARRRYGAEDVEIWRRSIDVAPPPASAYALAEQLADRRYQCAPAARLIRTESLGDVAARMAPYWRDVLAPELAADRVVVVVSHGNALRALLHLATGTPLAQTALTQVPTAMPIMPRAVLPVP